MIALEGGKALLATSTSAGRRGLTARTSADGGATWRTLATLEAGPSGYSALAELEGGYAGCLFEAKRPRPLTGSWGAPPAARPTDDGLSFVRVNVSGITRK